MLLSLCILGRGDEPRDLEEHPQDDASGASSSVLLAWVTVIPTLPNDVPSRRNDWSIALAGGEFPWGRDTVLRAGRLLSADVGKLKQLFLMNSRALPLAGREPPGATRSDR